MLKVTKDESLAINIKKVVNKKHGWLNSPLPNKVNPYFNQFLAQHSISISPENVRKPFFSRFQGGIEIGDWAKMG